jgi:hypothetical protein
VGNERVDLGTGNPGRQTAKCRKIYLDLSDMDAFIEKNKAMYH